MPRKMKGQWAFHTDVSLYVVHAIENNVGGRHVKDKPARFPLYRSIIAQAGGSICTRYGGLVFIRLPLMQRAPSSKTMFSSRKLRTSEIARPVKQEKTNKSRTMR